MNKDEARRREQLHRLGRAVALLRRDIAANQAASRCLLALGRPLSRDEVAQWRTLGREAEHLRHELAQLYAEFETMRRGQSGPY